MKRLSDDMDIDFFLFGRLSRKGIDLGFSRGNTTNRLRNFSGTTVAFGICLSFLTGERRIKGIDLGFSRGNITNRLEYRRTITLEYFPGSDTLTAGEHCSVNERCPAWFEQATTEVKEPFSKLLSSAKPFSENCRHKLSKIYLEKKNGVKKV
jgi:hypothetical protein